MMGKPGGESAARRGESATREGKGTASNGEEVTLEDKCTAREGESETRENSGVALKQGRAHCPREQAPRLGGRAARTGEAGGAPASGAGARLKPGKGGGWRGARHRESAYKVALALLVGLFMFALYLNNQSMIERMAEKNRAGREDAQAAPASESGEHLAEPAPGGAGGTPAATAGAGGELPDNGAQADGGAPADGSPASSPESSAKFSLHAYDGSEVPFSSYAGSAVFLVFWTEGDRQSAQLLRTLGEYEKSGGRPDAAKILNVLVPTAMPEAARGFQAGAGETAFAAAGAAASGTADDAIDATTGAVAGAATETYAPAAAAGAATETAAGSADGADSAANDAPAAATAGAATGAAYPAGGAGDPQGEASAVPDSLLAGYGLAPESSFYDADAALARTFMVAGYPSMFVFSRDGKLVDYIVGATGAGRIQEAARLAEAA